MPDNPPSELIKAIASGTAVPVVGAGISRAAADMPGWGAFIAECISFLKERGANTPALDCVNCLLAAGEYEIAGQIVQKALDRLQSIGEVLTLSFHRAPLKDDQKALPAAVWALNRRLLLTTNYDRVLELSGPQGVVTVTWREAYALWRAVRAVSDEDQLPSVVHLHGIYDNPDSVIFSVSDYTTLNQDPSYQAFGQSLWTNYTLLFVGASASGVGDMDFSRLFAWGRKVAPQQPFASYILLRDGEVQMAEKERLYREYRVRVVEYGDYPELLPYLQQLRARADDMTEPPHIPLPQLAEHQLFDLALLLLNTRALNSDASRQSILSRLSADVQREVHEALRTHSITGSVTQFRVIMNACLKEAHRLKRLMEEVHTAEGDSDEWRKLLTYVDALFPDLP